MWLSCLCRSSLMPKHIKRTEPPATSLREERYAKRSAVSSQDESKNNSSGPVGSGDVPSREHQENPPRAEDIMEEVDVPDPSSAMMNDRQAYDEIREMIKKELPEAYGVMQQEGPIALSELLRVAKSLLTQIEMFAKGDEVSLLMAATNLKRTQILARTFKATCTGRVIIYAAEGGLHEGVCLRPCCVGDNILHTLRQLGANAWKSGVDFLYTDLQLAWSDFPVMGKDPDGIKQCRITTGKRLLAFHKSTFPLVRVDLTSCPRMSEVLSGGTGCLTRAGYTLVLPLPVAPKPAASVPDPVAAGAAISGSAAADSKNKSGGRRKKAQAGYRSEAAMERMRALDSFLADSQKTATEAPDISLADSQKTATEAEILEMVALADETIIVQYAKMVMGFANAQVHPEARVSLLLTVVGSKAHFFSAKAPRHSNDAALRAALAAQAGEDGVDLNVFPGASGTCRVNYDLDDRIVLSDVALVRDSQGTGGGKLNPAPLMKNMMTCHERVIKSGEHELRIVMVDFIPNDTLCFPNLVGLAWGTKFHVPPPWAPDAPREAGQQAFENFDASTMVRYCENFEQCSRDPRLGRITLLSGVTGNMGIAPSSGKTLLGKKRVVKWCESCSGITSVGPQVRVQCCCGGSEQTVAKENTHRTKGKKIQKMRKELQFENAGAKWQMREQSTPGQCSSTASRDFYKDSSDDSEDESNSFEEGEKDDEGDEEDDAAGDDEEAEDGESDGGAGPVNKP